MSLQDLSCCPYPCFEILTRQVPFQSCMGEIVGLLLTKSAGVNGPCLIGSCVGKKMISSEPTASLAAPVHTGLVGQRQSEIWISSSPHKPFLQPAIDPMGSDKVFTLISTTTTVAGNSAHWQWPPPVYDSIHGLIFFIFPSF